MKYRVRESFTIVDGIFAGNSYNRGAIHEDIPQIVLAGYERYFEEIKSDTAAVKTIPTVEPKPEPPVRSGRTTTPAPETGCVKPKDEKEQITPNSEVIEP